MKNRKNTLILLYLLSFSFLCILSTSIKLVHATTTTTFGGTEGSGYYGYVKNTGDTYSTVHDASSGNGITNPTSSSPFTRISQEKWASSPYYGVFRSVASWYYTSDIPDNAVISAAKICLWGCEYWDLSDTEFYIRVQNWTSATGGTILLSDYSAFDGVNYDDGTFYSTSWQELAWNNITLSDFSIINKQGHTQVMFRSSREINSDVPTGHEEVGATDATLPQHMPLLEVTYTLPPSVYSRPVSTSVSVAALSSKGLSKILIGSQFFTLTSALFKVFSRNVFESQLFRFTDSVSSRFQPFKILSVGVLIGQRQLQWLTSGAGGNTYPYQFLQAMKIIGNVFRATPHITYYLDTAVIFSAAASRVRTVIRDVLGELSVNAIISNVQYSFGKVLLDDIRGFLGLSSITYRYVAPTVAISGGSPGVVTPAEEAAAAQAIAAAAVYGMSTEVLQRVSIGIAAAMALIFIWGVTGETKKNGKKKKRSWNI